MANEHEPSVQYEVFSRHRLHYGRLFFQVIAFAVVVVLLGAFVALQLPTTLQRILIFGGGGIFLATAFIAYRLNEQEAAYARLLARIEHDQPNWLSSPSIGGVSSRQLMPVGLGWRGHGRLQHLAAGSVALPVQESESAGNSQACRQRGRGALSGIGERSSDGLIGARTGPRLN